MPDYLEYKKQGYYVGSGMIESGNKVVVQKRLKQAGMRWSRTGAQNIVSLRAKYESKSSTGDEAATPGLQKGVISHKIGGKAHFMSWSFDVRYERTNVVRHQDMMTHNDRNC